MILGCGWTDCHSARRKTKVVPSDRILPAQSGPIRSRRGNCYQKGAVDTFVISLLVLSSIFFVRGSVEGIKIELAKVSGFGRSAIMVYLELLKQKTPWPLLVAF